MARFLLPATQNALSRARELSLSLSLTALWLAGHYILSI